MGEKRIKAIVYRGWADRYQRYMFELGTACQVYLDIMRAIEQASEDLTQLERERAVNQINEATNNIGVAIEKLRGLNALREVVNEVVSDKEPPQDSGMLNA
jgi:hypothetical protein